MSGRHGAALDHLACPVLWRRGFLRDGGREAYASLEKRVSVRYGITFAVYLGNITRRDDIATGDLHGIFERNKYG
jgi:hypothetical protein